MVTRETFDRFQGWLQTGGWIITNVRYADNNKFGPCLTFYYRYINKSNSAQNITGCGLVNGKWQMSTPYRINTPQPIAKKFFTGDYIGDSYTRAKFGANPSMGGGFCANGRNITKKNFIYTFFFRMSPALRRSATGWVLTAWSWTLTKPSSFG